jgi:hypothetical protein
MANQHFEFDVLRDLLEEASTIGQLVKNEQTFLDAYEAFRTGNRQDFHAILERLHLIERCRLVCEWIGAKECTFVCFDLCGPPKPLDHAPDPRQLAEAIVRITADAQATKQLVETIEKRDPAGFTRFIETHKLEAFCHLFCHWVCYIRYRLVCRWMCTPRLETRPSLADELQRAGKALRALLERKTLFDDAVAASSAGEAAKLRSVVEAAGLIQWCHFICFFFCSWHCVLVCLRMCRQFPIEPVRDQIKEAAAFAKAIHKLAERPTELSKLAAAAGAGDDETFAAIVGELKLQRYCLQLCHWLCFLRCRRFCRLVCPPIFNHPWFTHVGDFDIYADIDPATGLTNKAHGHGGPDFGFFGCLKLRGFCPKTSPAFAGAPMAYRFLFQQGGSTTPITGGFVCEVLVGSRYTLWNANPFALQSVRIRGTGTTSPTPPPAGPGVSPPDHFIVPDPQGWIPVDPNALDDGFNGWLTGFASWIAFPGGGNPAPPGLAAGSPVAVADQKNGVDAAITFQATRVATIAAVNGGAPPDYTNQLAKIRITNWGEVMLLDLLQFHSGGGNPCSPLSTDLDIEYTTDHELMAGWSLEMITAATIVPAPVFPSGTGPRGGAGSDHHNISSWPTCSYAIRLHARRSLTDGLVDDSDKFIEKTFCIGRRGPR